MIYIIVAVTEESPEEPLTVQSVVGRQFTASDREVLAASILQRKLEAGMKMIIDSHMKKENENEQSH